MYLKSTVLPVRYGIGNNNMSEKHRCLSLRYVDFVEYM